MLGITTADAIALGSLVVGFVAIYKGLQWGSKARTIMPLEPVAAGVGAGFVDREEMRLLRTSNERMAHSVEQIAGVAVEMLKLMNDKHDKSMLAAFDALAAEVRKDRADNARANSIIRGTPIE